MRVLPLPLPPAWRARGFSCISGNSNGKYAGDLTCFSVTDIVPVNLLTQFEEKNMAELITCPTCGGKISSNAAVCPHCGEPIRKTAKDRLHYLLVFLGIVFFVLSLLVFFAGRSLTGLLPLLIAVVFFCVALLRRKWMSRAIRKRPCFFRANMRPPSSFCPAWRARGFLCLRGRAAKCSHGWHGWRRRL